MTTIRKAAAAAALSIAAVSAGASVALAASLDDLYRSSMAIRACDFNVTRQEATALSRAIELKVSEVGYSEDEVTQITDGLNAERLADEPAFCAASEPTLAAVLAELT